MGSSVPNPSSTPFTVPEAQNVLTDWLVAIDAFYRGYTQLAQYTDQVRNETQLDCSQATQLLEDMRQELTRLVNELDRLSSRFDLRAHTTRLHTLSNRVTLLIGYK
jgi:hypothetical protein